MCSGEDGVRSRLLRDLPDRHFGMRRLSSRMNSLRVAEEIGTGNVDADLSASEAGKVFLSHVTVHAPSRLYAS